MVITTALATVPDAPPLPLLSPTPSVVDAAVVVPLLLLLGGALRRLAIAPGNSFASIAYRVPNSSLRLTLTVLPLSSLAALQQPDCAMDAKGVSWTFTVHDGDAKVFFYNKSAQVELNALTFEHLSPLRYALLAERVGQHG